MGDVHDRHEALETGEIPGMRKPYRTLGFGRAFLHMLQWAEAARFELATGINLNPLSRRAP
jgi:hypothetical protein